MATDAVSTVLALAALGSGGEGVIRGYYYNSNFYTDAAHTTECEKNTSILYVDITSDTAYTYTGTQFSTIVKDASSTVAGIMKLYTTTGQNTDGTVTQKVVTDEVATVNTTVSGLATRVNNLEARGRFLSDYNIGTGLPSTYPEIPSSAPTSYTYTFKAGDYYIISTVPSSGTKYMPQGSSISASRASTSETWVWTVGKQTTTDTFVVGDQFVYDGTSWIHVATAKDTSWGNIVGTLSNQTDLQTALNGKVSVPVTESYTIAASAWSSMSGNEPFAYSTEIEVTHTLSANTICRLVNDNAVSFANYGFAIGDVVDQNIKLFAMNAPTAAVTLKIEYYD